MINDDNKFLSSQSSGKNKHIIIFNHLVTKFHSLISDSNFEIELNDIQLLINSAKESEIK